MVNLLIFVIMIISVALVFYGGYLFSDYFLNNSVNKHKYIRVEAQKRIELEESDASGSYRIHPEKYEKFGSIESFKRRLNDELCRRGYPELTESFNYRASGIMEGEISE